MIKINNITKAMRAAKMKEEDLIQLRFELNKNDEGELVSWVDINHKDYNVMIDEGKRIEMCPKNLLSTMDGIEGLKSKFAIFNELANIESQKDLSGVKTEVKQEQPVIESVETPQVSTPTPTVSEIPVVETNTKTSKPKAKDFWGQHYTQTEWYKFDKETRKVMLDQMKNGSFVKPTAVVTPAGPVQTINPQVQVPGTVENIEIPVNTAPAVVEVPNTQAVAETPTQASTPAVEVPKLIIPGLE